MSTRGLIVKSSCERYGLGLVIVGEIYWANTWKVYKWYNLVIFTASVQEYADPVIDWLEQDRKYFKGRYYRQHCTNRNGTYIKDISSIEPDLSKVIILDNSPMSYMFHEGTKPYSYEAALYV